MMPADFKEWWLAVALTSSVSTIAMAAVPEQAGVVTNTNGATRNLGGPDLPGDKIVYLGEKTYRFERLKNEGEGPTHFLFLDQSSLTLGPNSEIVIDEFVYDPQAKTGKIAVSLLSGALRVVGGQISKNTATEVKTPAATIGIRGGITVVDHQAGPTGQGGRTTGVFLFGDSMTMTSPDGSQTQTVTRQGFGMTSEGGTLSGPNRVPTSDLSTLLSRMETPSGGNGGGPNPGGAPAGQLISTDGNPPGNLSPDRLGDTNRQQDSTPAGNGPSTSQASNNVNNNLRNILDTKPTNQS